MDNRFSNIDMNQKEHLFNQKIKTCIISYHMRSLVQAMKQNKDSSNNQT